MILISKHTKRSSRMAPMHINDIPHIKQIMAIGLALLRSCFRVLIYKFLKRQRHS